MLSYYALKDNRVVEDGPGAAHVIVVVDPDADEKKMLIATYGIDEHTLNSALDPDELSRLEFEPEHVAMIYRRPLNYTGGDRLTFKTSAAGLFLFKDRIILVFKEDLNIFSNRIFNRVSSLNDLWLRILYSSISHFLEHLRAIYEVTSELEAMLNTSQENRYLLQLFALEKSMVFYLNSIMTNGVLIERIRNNPARFGLPTEQVEFLDDMAIENTQCQRQADIYSNILSSLMDARASIISNNLNVQMKTLNVITIAIMVPTLVVSAFSMNVAIPLQRHPHAFWIIMGFATASVVLTAAWWITRRTK
ncbi:MAG: magnesium transporter CorA family protein [Candidatus Coatesbacteria bacterium]